MNDRELSTCYRSVKDLLFQIGLFPTDKTLKEMLSVADIPEPDFLMDHEPSEETLWMPSFRELVDAMKYTDNSHTEETHYFKAAKEADRIHSKTSHGRLSDGPNLFTRALSTYVNDKLNRENKQFVYTQFENENHLWYSNYFLTYPDRNESIKFEKLFDHLIDDLKNKGIVKELMTARKLTMKDVNNIVDRSRQQIPPSAKQGMIATHVL